MLRKMLLNYNIATDIKLFSAIEATFANKKEMSFNLEHHNTGLIPIFIVGMPRSGTTLIEQIISSSICYRCGNYLLYLNMALI